MPGKITSRDRTNPVLGMVNITDVHSMLNGFRNKVTLDCVDPSRNPVQKRFYFDIDFRRLQQIIDQPEPEGLSSSKAKSKKEQNPQEPKFIRINLSLNLPNQLNCEQTESIENTLSILVCGVKNKKPLLNDGNFILVEGFSDHDDLGIEGEEGGGPCCVQGFPMLDI